MDIIECATCRRMFRNTDGTAVCPNGHENEWSDTDRCYVPTREDA